LLAWLKASLSVPVNEKKQIPRAFSLTLRMARNDKVVSDDEGLSLHFLQHMYPFANQGTIPLSKE